MAEHVRRRLAAEGHPVEISCGRQSLSHIGTAKAQREAVVLIWSDDAPSAHYMLKWAADIDPAKQIEVSRTSRAPRLARRSTQVIDFTLWNGERGGPAWRALEDRLRTVSRATEPVKPPPLRAAMVLAAAGAVAVGEAAILRMHDGDHVAQAAPPVEEMAQVVTVHPGPAPEGVETLPEGGPLTTSEPASDPAEDPLDIYRPLHRRFAALDGPPAGALHAAHAAAPPMDFRSNAGLFDRLASLAAPLIHRDDETR